MDDDDLAPADDAPRPPFAAAGPSVTGVLDELRAMSRSYIAPSRLLSDLARVGLARWTLIVFALSILLSLLILGIAVWRGDYDPVLLQIPMAIGTLFGPLAGLAFGAVFRRERPGTEGD